MNWNVIRTGLATLGTLLVGLVQFAPQFFGCVTIGDRFDCTASWLPPQWAAGIGVALWVATLIAKALTQGGTVAENLGNKAVVVTPVDKQGTVTPTQVNSGLPAK